MALVKTVYAVDGDARRDACNKGFFIVFKLDKEHCQETRMRKSRCADVTKPTCCSARILRCTMHPYMTSSNKKVSVPRKSYLYGHRHFTTAANTLLGKALQPSAVFPTSCKTGGVALHFPHLRIARCPRVQVNQNENI